jgi:hypothetical protein
LQVIPFQDEEVDGQHGDDGDAARRPRGGRRGRRLPGGAVKNSD